MTVYSGLVFRSRLQSIHRDINKIKRMLRRAKKDIKSVDCKILQYMINDTEFEIARFEKDLKDHKASEETFDWFHSLGKISTLYGTR